MQAILALEDGTTFSGQGIGAPGERVGEVVFNTAMTGYQEMLTDPSYAGQLVTLTTAHVGSTGVNPQDMESGRIHAAGLIVRHYSRRHSSWRATQSLSDWMAGHGRSGIAGVDTRALTILLRDRGAQNGCLLVGESPDRDAAIRRARSCPPLRDQDLTAAVTAEGEGDWTEGSFDLQAGASARRADGPHVLCFDYGAKHSIMRLLVDSGCRVTVVPARTPLARALALKPDGVVLSNGPGDPESCAYAIDLIAGLLERAIPTFGICLGHQLLALASGARTVKMKLGHHGANHPVKDLASGQVLITAQNHGYTVDEASLPKNVIATHRSLFDGSLQGLRVTGKPAIGFQGHPEASPGPHDMRPLFERFVGIMASRQSSEALESGLGDGA